MRLSKQPHDGNCLRQDSVPLGSFVKFPRTAGQDKAEGNYYLYYPDPSSKEPLGLLEGQQMLRILTKAIDDLPKTERLVLTLLYFEELTLKETAAVLHMEERRVIKLQNRAISSLRRRLMRAVDRPNFVKKGVKRINALAQMEAATLRGVEKLGVVVENIPPQLTQTGLQDKQLKAQVQEKLLQVGIVVLPEEDIIANGLPYLHLNINIMNTNAGLYVFATRVSLKQTVLLSHGVDLELYTSTWETGGIGTVGVNKVEDVLESIRQQINKFCHDYLAWNIESGSDDLLGAEKPEPPADSRQQLNWGLNN